MSGTTHLVSAALAQVLATRRRADAEFTARDWYARRAVCGRNGIAERFVLTVRTELTDRMPIFGQAHLRRVLAPYAAHYNIRRPDRALQLRPLPPEALNREPIHGPIQRRPILGVLINEYDRAA